MWLCFNDGFISVVEYRHNREKLLIRSRHADILRSLFPTKRIIRNDARDYRYRVEATRAEFFPLIAERIMNIDYFNFKESVQDHELHRLYDDFSTLQQGYQR
jgi:hypothetical protein